MQSCRFRQSEKMWGRILSTVRYGTPNGFGRIRIEPISYEYETIDRIQIRAAYSFSFYVHLLDRNDYDDYNINLLCKTFATMQIIQSRYNHEKTLSGRKNLRSIFLGTVTVLDGYMASPFHIDQGEQSRQLTSKSLKLRRNGSRIPIN